MPIFVEDTPVKINGVLLPGALKSLEITQEAAIDEVEVEGSATKPKQAVGYEDAQIKLDLIVDETPTASIDDRLAVLNALFRQKGQEIPQPVDMVCKQTASAGIGKVLFKKLTSKRTNKSDQFTVTLEFCQYVPQKITVAPAGAGGSGSSVSPDYQSYLDNDRGGAPKTSGKYEATPATDTRKYGPATQAQLDRLHRRAKG